MQKIASIVLIFLCSNLLVAQDVAPEKSASTLGDVTPEKSASTMGADRSAIENAIRSYVTAFNAQDANAMAQLWSPEGVYVNKLTGEHVAGRDAIAQSLNEIFAQPAKRQLTVATETIELISPNVALEQGSATVTSPDQADMQTKYRSIFVRRDGKWLFDRVTEEVTATGDDSAYQRLMELEWLIGDWVDQAGDDTISFECDWTKNRNFISRKFAVNVDGQVDSSGLQVIGWDPKQKQIRSWLFDSSGGFVKGVWTKKEDRWFVASVGTFADGATGSFTSIFEPVDQNSYSWEKVQRFVDGKMLPNLDEVVISRQ